MHRENRLAAAFSDLSDIDADDFDISSYARVLTRHVVQLLHADAAGLLIASRNGRLEEQGATSKDAQNLQCLQIRLDAGPGVESFRAGQRPSEPNTHAGSKHPEFDQAVLRAGFSTVVSLPLRVRDKTIGSMTLYLRHENTLAEDDVRLAESLARVATAYLILRQALDTSFDLNRQLQDALCVRVIIEQAKGILAERRGSTLAGAFELMRTVARRDRRKLNEVAHDIIEDSPGVHGLAIRRPGLRKPRNKGGRFGSRAP